MDATLQAFVEQVVCTDQSDVLKRFVEHVLSNSQCKNVLQTCSMAKVQLVFHRNDSRRQALLISLHDPVWDEGCAFPFPAQFHGKTVIVRTNRDHLATGWHQSLKTDNGDESYHPEPALHHQLCDRTDVMGYSMRYNNKTKTRTLYVFIDNHADYVPWNEKPLPGSTGDGACIMIVSAFRRPYGKASCGTMGLPLRMDGRDYAITCDHVTTKDMRVVLGDGKSKWNITHRMLEGAYRNKDLDYCIFEYDRHLTHRRIVEAHRENSKHFSSVFSDMPTLLDLWSEPWINRDKRVFKVGFSSKYTESEVCSTLFEKSTCFHVSWSSHESYGRFTLLPEAIVYLRRLCATSLDPEFRLSCRIPTQSKAEHVYWERKYLVRNCKTRHVPTGKTIIVPFSEEGDSGSAIITGQGHWVAMLTHGIFISDHEYSVCVPMREIVKDLRQVHKVSDIQMGDAYAKVISYDSYNHATGLGLLTIVVVTLAFLVL